MSQMNSIAIAPDTKSVTIGGGAKVKDVIKALSAAGKRTGQLPSMEVLLMQVFMCNSYWLL